MRVLPIIFKTDMVQAILDGRKTMTRRVIKPQPKMILSFNLAGYGHEKWSYPPLKAHELWGEKYKWPDSITKEDKSMLWTPPCHTDDILYVRETWNHYCYENTNDNISMDGYVYKASPAIIQDLPPIVRSMVGEKWVPSIHMPKTAARIWLKVTDVRVERLRDITEEQAIAEGTPYDLCGGWKPTFYDPDSGGPDPDFIRGFSKLWDSTIKKSDLALYGWDANPWVWVIEFERCEKPEEENNG